MVKFIPQLILRAATALAPMLYAAGRKRKSTASKSRSRVKKPKRAIYKAKRTKKSRTMVVRKSSSGSAITSISRRRLRNRPSSKFVKKVKQAMATPVEFANHETQTAVAATNACDFVSFQLASCTDLQDRIWAHLRNNIGAAYGGNNVNVIFDNTRTSQITIDYRKLKLKYVNRSNAIANIRFYECIARRDVPSAVNNTIFPSVDNNTLDSKIDGKTLPLVTNLSFTLYDDSQFCQYWKILNTWTEQLQVGQEGQVNLEYGPCTYRPSLCSYTDSLRNVSTVLFAQVMGSPARDIVDTTTIYGISAAHVDFFSQEFYAAYFTENPSQFDIVDINLGTISSNGKIWNSASGALETITNG